MDRIQSFNLENGLKLYLEMIPIRECSAYLVVNAGAIHDRVPETAHVVEHMQGSGARLYGERGVLNYVHTESYFEDTRSVYSCPCMFADDLSKALKKLSLVLTQPHTCWLERERSFVRDDLNDTETPYTHIDEKIFSVLFPKTAKYFPTIKRRISGLRNIDEDVCREFFRDNYSPGNSYLYIGGKLSSDFDKAMARFRNIPVRKQAKQIELPSDLPLDERVEMKDKWAGNTGRITIAYQAPLYPEIPLTEHIARIFLQSFLAEDYGPLYRRLRDKQKLCNGVDVVFNKYGKAGQLAFIVDTKPAKFSLVEHEFLQALTHIAIKSIRNDHLESFRKAHSISHLHMINHPDIKRAFTKLDFGVDSDEVDEAVSRVTQQDIANVARTLLNRGYVVSLAFPS